MNNLKQQQIKFVKDFYKHVVEDIVFYHKEQNRVNAKNEKLTLPLLTEIMNERITGYKWENEWENEWTIKDFFRKEVIKIPNDKSKSYEENLEPILKLLVEYSNDVSKRNPDNLIAKMLPSYFIEVYNRIFESEMEFNDFEKDAEKLSDSLNRN